MRFLREKNVCLQLKKQNGSAYGFNYLSSVIMKTQTGNGSDHVSGGHWNTDTSTLIY